MLALSEPNSTFAEMDKEDGQMVITLREALNKYDSWLYIVYVG